MILIKKIIDMTEDEKVQFIKDIRLGNVKIDKTDKGENYIHMISKENSKFIILKDLVSMFLPIPTVVDSQYRTFIEVLQKSLKIIKRTENDFFENEGEYYCRDFSSVIKNIDLLKYSLEEALPLALKAFEIEDSIIQESIESKKKNNLRKSK